MRNSSDASSDKQLPLHRIDLRTRQVKVLVTQHYKPMFCCLDSFTDCMVFELFWRHTHGCGSGTWHRNNLRFVCSRTYNVQVKYLLISCSLLFSTNHSLIHARAHAPTRPRAHAPTHELSPSIHPFIYLSINDQSFDRSIV